MKKWIYSLIFILCFFTLLPSSWAMHYEMILFSYDHPVIPGWTPHTFATFYKVDADQTPSYQEITTISWLPQSSPEDVTLFARAVAGKNYNLIETLEFAVQKNKDIWAQGPFEISKELFELAKDQEKKLNSGHIKYRVTFTQRTGEQKAYHCVFAVSDIYTDNGLMDNGLSHTMKSMQKIRKHFDQFILSTNKWDHDLLDALDILSFVDEIIHD